MSRVLTITTWDEQDIQYQCAHCGFTDLVWVHAPGTGEVDVTFRREHTQVDTAAERAYSNARRSIDEAIATIACPQCRHRERRAVRRVFLRRSGLGLGIATLASMIGLMIATSAEANPLVGMAIAFALVWPVASYITYRVAQRTLDRHVSFMSL